VLLGTAGPAYAGESSREVETSVLGYPDIEVWVTASASAQKIDAVENEIVATEDVELFAKASRAQMLEILRASDPDSDLRLADAPVAFRIKLVDGAKPGRVVRRLERLPGVSSASISDIKEKCEDPDPPKPRFEIFMFVDATESDILGVRRVLEASSLVADFTYLDQDAVFKEFKRIFKKDPDLVRHISPDSLPTSFQVIPVDPTDSEALEALVRDLPGVDDVDTPDAAIDLAELCAIYRDDERR
jgi:cell division protein FtsX